MESIQELIQKPEYDFLRNDRHLGRNVLFVTYGDAYAFGTETEFSVPEIRGCTCGNRSDIFGLSAFQQFVDRGTGTTVHSLFKLFSKALSGDIKLLEMLGCKDGHYAMVSALGQELLDNRNLFFSKKAVSAYTGYIGALQEAVTNSYVRANLGRQVYEKALLAQCENAVEKFNKAFPEKAAKVYIRPSEKDNMFIETYMDIHIDGCPVRDFNSLLTSTGNIVDVLEKSAARRNYLDSAWLSRKMAELIRTLYTCRDLLETGFIHTNRAAERDLILSVKDGKYTLRDCKASPEFFELVNGLLGQIETAKKETPLPDEPDYRILDELLMDLNAKAVSE